MNKSILVVDTPESCKECPLCKNYMKVHHVDKEDTYEIHCIGTGDTILKEVGYEKPNWCPLENYE